MELDMLVTYIIKFTIVDKGLFYIIWLRKVFFLI